MISSELVKRMKTWRHSGFRAFAGEEIPEISDALRVGLYIVQGAAATSRLCTDPAQEPKLRSKAFEIGVSVVSHIRENHEKRELGGKPNSL